MEYSAKTLTILQNLIRIRSCLPEGDELDVVKYIVSLFEPYGTAANIVRHGDNRASLVLSLKGDGNGAKRALMAHLDTVSPLEPRRWRHAPFAADFDGEKVYGCGASSSKGGVAAICAAALSLLEKKCPPFEDTLLCFTAGGDDDGMGARSLLEGGFLDGISEVIFADPTGLGIATAQQGAVWMKARVSGRRVHVLEAEKGIDALYWLLEFVRRIKGLLKEARPHFLLGGSTVYLTGVSTSEKEVCILPESACGNIDIRLIPSVDLAGFIKDTDRLIAEMTEEVPGLSIDYDILNARPPVGVSADSPIVRRIESICRREGIENARSGLGYFSDSSVIVKELGVPFVILGPGERVFDDRMDEYVYMSKVCAAQKIYEKYMSE